MPRPRVLALIQAGGVGGRMDVLTRERAKPALSFAGVHQLVDFPLSNLANSGVSDVWLSVQYQASALQDQVRNGRPWDLDRTHGGLRLLIPQEGTGSMDEEGFAQGNADELFRIRDEVRAHGADLVVVASADHVYRLDHRDVVATHLDAGAECTVVVTEVSPDEAGQHAVVEHDERGVVTGFEYKPEHPSSTTVATEVFLYDAEVLVQVLEEVHRELGPDSPGGDTGLGDFGEHLLPRLVESGKVAAVPLTGYWKDVGQPGLYLAAPRDVLTDALGVLDRGDWPILTRQPQRVPARVLRGGEVVDSLVSPGARVAGRVAGSVLGPGVVVEQGAEVCDSVLFADVRVESGAQVARSVVDTGTVVGRGARVGSSEAEAFSDSAQVTLLGRGSTVTAGTRVAAGARWEPGTTA